MLVVCFQISLFQANIDLARLAAQSDLPNAAQIAQMAMMRANATVVAIRSKLWSDGFFYSYDLKVRVREGSSDKWRRLINEGSCSVKLKKNTKLTAVLFPVKLFSSLLENTQDNFVTLFVNEVYSVWWVCLLPVLSHRHAKDC